MKTFILNTSYYLETTLTDKNGDFVTALDSGETVDYEVRRSSDNSLIASGSMTVEGDVFKTSISLSVLGQYRALYFTPTKYENGSEIIEVVDKIADRVWDEPLSGHLTVGSTGEALDDADAVADANAVANAVWNVLVAGSGSSTFGEVILRIAGLCQENMRIINPVYAINNNTNEKELISGKIRIFSSAVDCNNNTNPIAEYNVVATYDSEDNMGGYKVVKV